MFWAFVFLLTTFFAPLGQASSRQGPLPLPVAEPAHATCLAMRKQSVLIMCLLDSCGGVRTHAFTLYQLLDELGFNPVMLVLKEARQVREFALKRKTRFVEYTCPTTQRAGGVSLGLLERVTATRAFDDFLENICLRHRVGVVHANFPLEVPPIRRLKARGTKLKLVYTIHDDSSSWRTNIEGCDGVIGVNPSIVDALCKEHPERTESFFFCPPTFDERPYVGFSSAEGKDAFFKRKFGIDIKGRMVCTIVANYFGYKNQRVAVKAFAELVHRHKQPVCLMLAGKGPAGDALALLVKKLRLSKHVYLLGYVKEVASLIFHSDLILNTSERDACPITLMEAAALRRPIIATRGTGSNLLVEDEVTGLLFHHRQPGELVAAIMRYRKDQDFAACMAANGRDRVLAYFSLQATAARLLQVYGKLGLE